MKLKHFLEAIKEMDLDPESDIILEIINEEDIEHRHDTHKGGDIELSYCDGSVYIGGYSDMAIVGKGMA